MITLHSIQKQIIQYYVNKDLVKKKDLNMPTYMFRKQLRKHADWLNIVFL